MRYENYERKMRALKKAADLVHSVRFYIIGGASVAAVATGTLLSVKGITEVKEVPESITYGERFTPSSTAVMGDAVIEYASVGSNDWTSTQPTLVGKYRARSTSKNGFGLTYHSKEEAFEILPKAVDVSIKNSSITYGEEPAINSLDLVSEDQLETYHVTYGEIVDYKTTASVTDLKIVNSDGVDVTFCYDFHVLEKELEITKRHLGVDFTAVTKEYDGTPLTSNSYTFNEGSLASGDSFIVGEGKTITDIGVISNSVAYHIENEAGEDVTKFYDIASTFGDLEITKRHLTISTNSIAREYDGTTVEDELSYDCVGSLMAGDTLSVVYQNADLFAPTTETVSNAFSYQILDANHNDVSYRYDVVVSPGTIDIEKRNFSYATESVEKTYDNGLLELNPAGYQITAGSLADGDRITWEYDETVKNLYNPTLDAEGNAISVENKINVKIYNDKNENVTSYYDLNADNGSLMIKKRSLKIDMPYYAGIYDGQEHVLDDAKIVADVGDGLLPSQYAFIENPVTCLDAGEYQNKDKSTVRITDAEGNDVSSYYDISYQYHSSLIEKREVTIQASDITTEYSGENIITKDAEVDEDGYSILEGSLASGETVSAIYNTTVKDASKGSYGITVNIVNAATKRKTTDNYKASILNGTYDVTLPTIHIDTLNYKKTYDGTSALPVTSGKDQEGVFWQMRGELKSGDQWGTYPTVTVDKTSIDANESGSTYAYTVNDDPLKTGCLKIVDSKNTDHTANYNIIVTANAGALTVAKRKVTITPNDAQFTYDGESRTMQGSWASSTDHSGNFTVEGELAANQTLNIAATQSVYKYEDSGTAIDLSSVTVTNKSGEDVTNNYEISRSETQSYTIHKRALTIYTRSGLKSFDNELYKLDEIDCENNEGDRGLATTDNIDMSKAWPTDETTCRPLDVVDCDDDTKNVNTCDESQIKIFNGLTGEDVTSSYEIEVVYGTLQITTRTVAIDFYDISSVYSGSSKTYDDFEVNSSSSDRGATLHTGTLYEQLPSDFHVYAHVDPDKASTFTEASSYNFSEALYFSVETDSGETLLADSRTATIDAKKDFAFVTFGSGSLTIGAKTITITCYGGNYMYFDGVQASEKKTVTGLASGDKLYFVRDAGASYRDNASFTSTEVTAYFEAYESGENNYDCFDDMTGDSNDDMTYTVTVNSEDWVVLKQDGATYKNVTSSYKANVVEATVNIYHKN